MLVYVLVALGHSSSFEGNAVDEVFENVLSWLERIVGCFLAVPGNDVFNAISFAQVTHNAIEGAFAQRVREFFCNSLSSAFVGCLVSFVPWLAWFVWCVYDLLLYKLS